MSAPHALYFGPAGARLFGWLHAAAGEGGLGLVVCNPFGFEEVCAHRALRHVATAASAAGVPTLRFDYAGCGNSEGDEFAPDGLARWVQSVHEAVDALKRATGVERVCLLGVRLGAALAALAAAQRSDVSGLVAVAPVLSGRGYLRELTLLGGAGARNVDGTVESAGFLLPQDTSDALGRLDLRQQHVRPAPRVLIVERDDLPGGGAQWVPALESLGAEVSVVSWAGYAGMMLDPQRAEVPTEIVHGAAAWLKALQGGAPPRTRAPEPVGARAFTSEMAGNEGAAAIREAVVEIDAGSTRLFGVLTTGTAPCGPAVLMLNSGSVHHIGPNRLWVRLSRRWAARGLTVLRIDLSGIGDSPARSGAVENIVYSSHAAQDIAAALGFLRAHGATECHLVGLCSGAYHALKAAVAGQPLVSSLMINPLTYFWQEGDELNEFQDYEVSGLLSKYRGKLFTPDPWRKLVSGKLEVRMIAQVALRRVWNAFAPSVIEAARWLRLPLKQDLASELFAATGRGIRLQFVFAAQAPGFALLRRQSGRAIGKLLRRRQASIDFISDADHTFTRREARERLVATLDRLIQSACAGH